MQVTLFVIFNDVLFSVYISVGFTLFIGHKDP